MTAHDDLLDAWIAWDAVPINVVAVHRHIDARNALADELGVSPVWVQRRQAAGRRAGLAHDTILDRIASDARSAAVSAVDRPPSLFGDSLVRVEPIERAECNRFLVDWDHQLGPCNRPFGQDHWLLICRGRPVALAVSASIVSPTVRDEHDETWPRNRTLELARIAHHPDEPWSLRVMLRLWREELVPEWSHWTPDLLASYALPGRTGNLYRFDGWVKVRTVAPSNPGPTSTWSKPSKSDAVGNGRKTLWMHHRSAA